jgi:multiple antibiotic resistance protein
MNLSLLWKYFALGFSALLPLVNPIGSAILLVGIVGTVPLSLYRMLARRIAINVIIFFAIIELGGAAVLRFFGISLPIVQISGGLVIASIGWSLLNQQENRPNAEKMQAETAVDDEVTDSLAEKAFYPLTFPLTVGPGCLVVTLTLSAQAAQRTIPDTLISHAGIFLSAICMGILVYICYANAPRITHSIAPTTAHGILRVIAFILLCIGVQIAWSGVKALLQPYLLQHHF